MAKEYHRPKDQYNGDELLTKMLEMFRWESDVLFHLTMINSGSYLIEAFPEALQHVPDPVLTSDLHGKTVQFYRQENPDGSSRYIRFAGPGQYHLIRISKQYPTGLLVATELIAAPFQDREIPIIPTLVRFCRDDSDSATQNKFHDLAFEKALLKLEGRIKVSAKDAVEVLHTAHMEYANYGYGQDKCHKIVNLSRPLEA